MAHGIVDAGPAARLAAEFAGNPEMNIIREQEDAFRQKAATDNNSRYIEIDERTADFCVRAVKSLLSHPGNFESRDWDGNDFVFLQDVVASLQKQLMRPQVHSL